jgi:DNA-binding winged helix-turn-helix (wHTH) protein
LASDDDLIEHAWPGEKMLADSATTRLQKAVSDLRKLGLGDVIERAENGYRIHPSQRVIKLPDEFDEWWLRRFRKTQNQAP